MIHLPSTEGHPCVIGQRRVASEAEILRHEYMNDYCSVEARRYTEGGTRIDPGVLLGGRNKYSSNGVRGLQGKTLRAASPLST